MNVTKSKDESSVLHLLMRRLVEKEASVGIVGLGYVGLPLAIAFSRKFRVVGLDINEKRVRELSSGIDATDSVSAEDLNSKNLSLTTDAKKLRDCAVIIVAVPTPVTNQHQPDFTPLIKASETIAQNMSRGVYVVYESTVYPGATEECCIPVLEKVSGCKAGVDFKVGYSPERINPGDQINRLESIVKIVSGMDDDSCEALYQLYGSILLNGVHRAPNMKVAEAAKVFENAQRDVNIAAVNELAFFCHKIGIDTNDVLDACKTKWNFLGFQPGLVGGHCIGVDPYYLIAKSLEISAEPAMTRAARSTNQNVALFIADQVFKLLIRLKKASSDIRINLLGFTYKEDTPDIRNTQIARLVSEFHDAGCKVFIADPLADPFEVKHEYGFTLTNYKDLPAADATIFAVPHKLFLNLTMDDWRSYCKAPPLIFDLKSSLDREIFETAGFHLWRL